MLRRSMRRTALSQHRSFHLYRVAQQVVELLERRQLLSAGTGLQGLYFDNADFSAYKLARTDAQVNFDFATGSPDPSIAADTFSVRWLGQVEIPTTGAWTFYTTSDDGVRLWIDGQLVINNWTDHGPTENSATVSLMGGRRYDIQVDYYESTGGAVAKLEWAGPDQTRQAIPTARLFPARQGGLLREVWNNITGSSVSNLTGNAAYPNSPSAVTVYSAAETPSNSADNYGDRLRGYVLAPTTGNYTFYIASDDSSQLWLSNSADPAGKKQIASVTGYTSSRQWTKYASQKSAVIPLVAGQRYYIEALHKEGTGGDNLAIGWTVPGSSTVSVIPSYYLSPVLPRVSLYQLQTQMIEGADQSARFQVVREGTSLVSPLTVSYRTTGSATSGADYTALSGTVTIAAGSASAEIQVRPLQDSAIEGQEAITVELKDSDQYTLDDLSSQQATGIITDDDFASPSPGQSMLPASPLPAFSVWGTGATGQVVSVTGPGITQALQVATTTRPANPWDIQAAQPVIQPVRQGDVLMLEFVARATVGSGQMTAVLERAGSPYTKSLSQTITFGGEWSKFQLPCTAAETYAANGMQFGFQLGFDPQTIQIGGVTLTNYGPAASMLPTDTVAGWGGVNTAYGSTRTVAVSGQPFAKAVEVQTGTGIANPWDVQLLQSTTLAIAAGETAYLEFYARSAGSTNATFTAIFQKADNPWTKSLSSAQTVGTAWTLFRLPFASLESYSAGAASVGFFCGYSSQTLQFGGMRLVRVPLAKPVLAENPLAAFWAPNSAYATSQIVSVTGQPFSQALRLQITAKPTNFWEVQVGQPGLLPAAAGDSMYLEFYARSGGTGSATFAAVLERAGDPYTKSLFSQNTVGTSWTLYRLPFTMAETYAANGYNFSFQAGYAAGTLEFGQVRLINASQAISLDMFPKTAAAQNYLGREGTSSWRSTANTNIDQLRKGNLTVTVKDSTGKLINGATVIMRQTKHDFVFGTEMDAGLMVRGTSADAQKYREVARELFNTVVIGNALKWPNWLDDRQLAIDSANWVVNNAMKLRGHNLVWPSRTFMPASVWSTYDQKVASEGAAAAAQWLRQTCMDHITDEMNALKGKAFQWDVVNEPYANHDVMDILGNSVMIDWFKAANNIDPGSAMYLNDYSIFTTSSWDDAHRDNFDYWINYLKTNGAPIEGIGEQSHFGAKPPDITGLQSVIDRFARFGLPIVITEYDHGTSDRQLQADYLRDYFTLMFGQSSIQGLMQWGYWQNAHWIPDGALYNSDWTIRPNGQQYKDLVFNDWWSDVKGTTWTNGTFTARVFKGTYEVIVQNGGITQTATATLNGSTGAITVTLGSALKATTTKLSSPALFSTVPVGNSSTGTQSENVILSRPKKLLG